MVAGCERINRTMGRSGCGVPSQEPSSWCDIVLRILLILYYYEPNTDGHKKIFIFVFEHNLPFTRLLNYCYSITEYVYCHIKFYCVTVTRSSFFAQSVYTLRYCYSKFLFWAILKSAWRLWSWDVVASKPNFQFRCGQNRARCTNRAPWDLDGRRKPSKRLSYHPIFWV